jgi:hypothetical protein
VPVAPVVFSVRPRQILFVQILLNVESLRDNWDVSRKLMVHGQRFFGGAGLRSERISVRHIQIQ